MMDKQGISGFVLGLVFMLLGLVAASALFLRCFVTTYKNSFVDFSALFSCTTSPLTLVVIVLGVLMAIIGAVVMHFSNR